MNYIVININIAHLSHRRVGTAWAHVALPRGPECHVASTWDTCEKLSPFCLLLNHFIHLKIEINSEKIRKKSIKIENS